MRRNSLALRLVAIAAVWSVVALVIAGLVLVELYRDAGERAFDERLDVYLTSLIGGVSAQEGQVSAPDMPGEPRFRLPLSGWYWTVRSQSDVLFASESLVGDALRLPPLEQGSAVWRGYATGPAGEEVRAVVRQIAYGDRQLVISVAGETSTLATETATFAGQVALTLSVLGAGLLLAVLAQVVMGLRPLDRLRRSFAAVRRGEAERIDEDLPLEIAPLAEELNALIASNREIVERARAHVGNLAHALKTPLSVITNEVRELPGGGRRLAEQAALMRTQIDHHLDRARMAAQRRVIGVATEVTPVADALVRAMRKIHGGRGIVIDTAREAGVAPDLRFRGERQDLEEMLGNLLDNACKWATGQVVVRLAPAEAEGRAARTRFAIFIEDDGPGLSEEERREAMKRGRRLDETVPGSGLGLSIVADLVALYGGAFTLEPAPGGGLRARLELPSA